jgi:hypothetical protein
MTTPRTATAKWKKVRARVLADAQAAGLQTCPICHVPLDFETGKKPNSAEVDHVVPYARGGTDDPSNLRVICRLDNQRRGAGPSACLGPPGRHPACQIQFDCSAAPAWRAGLCGHGQ